MLGVAFLLKEYYPPNPQMTCKGQQTAFKYILKLAKIHIQNL